MPAFTAPVVDQAQVMSAETESKLSQALESVRKKGGSQIAVLTVASLGGEAIEQVSIQVVDRWKLGTATKDNGVLLLVATQDRQVRIEVGQGLEGDLPDAYAKRIVEDTIVPYFKAGDVESGIVAGVQAILSRTDPGLELGSAPAQRSSPARLHVPGGHILQLVFFLIFFVVSSIFRGFSGRRRSPWGLSPSGHWGGGGFRGGFGGGGGGGFSGGGASGRW
ncbi:MAG: YgcG family protein [Bdellovibrionales bacterium]